MMWRLRIWLTACASEMKRSTASESLSATRCRTLTAARRLSSGCSASYTAPKPPSPSLRSSRYSPAMRPLLSLERRAGVDGGPGIVSARDDTTPLCDHDKLPLSPVSGPDAAPSARETDIDSNFRRRWVAITIETRAEALAGHAGAGGGAEPLLCGG